MLTAEGVVKIGDLGLARLFSDPLQSLYAGDKVVVTIWYRAPELLLGCHHYTPSIDLWAVGCIFAELLSLRPIFKGEEAKADNNYNNNNDNNGSGKRIIPFQKNQFQKIVDILGMPTTELWPMIQHYPEYTSLSTLKIGKSNYDNWCNKNFEGYSELTARNGAALLKVLLTYDPLNREEASSALLHSFFVGNGNTRFTLNAFEGQNYEYPARRISFDDFDIKSFSQAGSNPSNTKPAAISSDKIGIVRKRKLV